MIKVPHHMSPCPFQRADLVPKTLHCASGYAAAVTEEGAVLTWGSGEFGRLGYQDCRRQ